MSEDDRNKAIQKIIDDLIKKEKEEAEAQQREEYLAQQQGPQFNNDNSAKQNTTILSGDKSWYFYNKPMVSAGKTEFQRIWGSRKLEDDWRRRNKSGFSMSDFAEQSGNSENEDLADNSLPDEENPDSIQSDAADDPHKPEFYLKQIPMTPEAMETSNEVVAEGLFNMGIILKNKLEDYPAAIANFNLLEERFPENPYRLDVYYNMYLMYMRNGDVVTAGIYRDKIRSVFPESPYAQAMADPHYLDNLRRMSTVQDSIYEATYAAYLENDNRTVHGNTTFMKEKYPLSPLMPKFLFLDALAYIGDKSVRPFQSRLERSARTLPASRRFAYGDHNAQRSRSGTSGCRRQREHAGNDLEGTAHQRYDDVGERYRSGNVHTRPECTARAASGLCDRQRIVQSITLRRGETQLHQLRH